MLEEEDRHGSKEIVRYWEDCLAIYANGMCKERHEVEMPTSQEAPQGDDDQGEDKGEGHKQ